MSVDKYRRLIDSDVIWKCSACIKGLPPFNSIEAVDVFHFDFMKNLPTPKLTFSVDDSDLEEAMKKYSVKNTTLNNKWALKNSEKRSTTEEPLNVLLTDDPAVLCDTLCVYIKETRKTDGTPYSPKTLYLLLA